MAASPSRSTDVPPAARLELIRWMQQQVDAVLRPLLAGEREFALLDFPNHHNVGDCAIWLGERAYLRALGITRLRYVCDVATYARDHLRRAIGRGTILLHGGGNFGDLWPPHQQFREEVVQAFPDNRIIVFPQSVCFESAAALARARAIFNRHRNLILLLRDQQSLAMAQREFAARSLLCPDMAVCLGPMLRPRPASQPILWLARSDPEAVNAQPAGALLGIPRVNWPHDRPTPLMLASRLGRKIPLRARSMYWVRRPLSAAYEWFARARVARGCRLLSAGATVVTDRLHGHLLSLQLGIPHVVVDTRFGKIRAFHETWTSRSDLTRWATTHEEALRMARDQPAHVASI